MKLSRVRRGKWKIFAVCTSRGACPLLEFLAGLEGQLARDGRRMLKLLDRIAEHGPPRNTEISHQIDREIWQLTQGRIRVLWFYDEGRVVLCSHGFVKKGRKTPNSEIARARQALWDYRGAKRRGEVEIGGW